MLGDTPRPHLDPKRRREETGQPEARNGIETVTVERLVRIDAS